jgi:hypothetical protein
MVGGLVGGLHGTPVITSVPWAPRRGYKSAPTDLGDTGRQRLHHWRR